MSLCALGNGDRKQLVADSRQELCYQEVCPLLQERSGADEWTQAGDLMELRSRMQQEICVVPEVGATQEQERGRGKKSCH